MKTKKILLASASLTIFSLSIILFQISCKKDATAQNSTNNCIGPQPKFQFKANGVLNNCDAVYNNRIGWINGPSFCLNNKPGSSHYELVSSDGYGFSNGGNSIIFILPNNQQPATGLFSITDTDSYINGVNYAQCNQTIIITAIENNGTTIKGTFSGTFTNGTNNITITDGEFSEVPIIN